MGLHPRSLYHFLAVGALHRDIDALLLMALQISFSYSLRASFWGSSARNSFIWALRFMAQQLIIRQYFMAPEFLVLAGDFQFREQIPDYFVSLLSELRLDGAFHGALGRIGKPF